MIESLQLAKMYVCHSFSVFLWKVAADTYLLQYRAGATHDVEDDKNSGINPVTRPASEAAPAFKRPLLILYSHHLGRRFDVGGIWRELSHPDKVSVHQVGDETTGHFIVNEKQEETGKRLREWLDTLEL